MRPRLPGGLVSWSRWRRAAASASLPQGSSSGRVMDGRLCRPRQRGRNFAPCRRMLACLRISSLRPVVVLVAVLWAILPLLPALLRGELPGSPYTDLYPSVWGLDVFTSGLPGLVTHTTRMGAPGGIGFYYSSPLHGLLGWPVHALAGTDVRPGATLIPTRRSPCTRSPAPKPAPATR